MINLIIISLNVNNNALYIIHFFLATLFAAGLNPISATWTIPNQTSSNDNKFNFG